MAKSIKLGADTYLDASGVVMSDNSTLDTAHNNYTKLPDGTLIQWGFIINPTPASATGSAWTGNLYFHEYKDPVTFPIPFISDPVLIVSKAGGRAGMVCWSLVSMTKIAEIDIISSSSTPTTGVYLSWLAVGRWK